MHCKHLAQVELVLSPIQKKKERLVAFPLCYAAQGEDRLFVENNDPLAPSTREGWLADSGLTDLIAPGCNCAG
ncbi:hypothetical protein DENIT_11233 [Pseudomonas veronii]|nr:hypothetical protein DENIT_11233 [Pseudomonas veronii]